MTQRLPIPGSDNGTWGAILNDFLEVSHNNDGTIAPTALNQAGAITTINSKTPTNGSVTLAATDVGALTQSAADARYPQSGAYVASVTAPAPSGDTTGVTDHTAIAALITTASANAAISGTPVTIWFPGGTYYFSTSLNSASNVVLDGSWRSTIFKLKSGAQLYDAGILQVTSSTVSFTARNIILDGQSTANTTANCGVASASGGGFGDIHLEKLLIRNVSYMGICLLGDVTRTVITTDVFIEDCKTINTGAHGILCQGGIDNCHIRRCTVTNYCLTATGSGPGITNGRAAYNTSMIDNTVDGTNSLGSSTQCISLDTPYGGAVVSENKCYNPTGYGIELGYATDAICTANVIRGGNVGINITSNGSPTINGNLNGTAYGLTITGNIIDGCSSFGIGSYMGSPGTNSATPANQTSLRSTAYTAGAQVRILEGVRLYLCTSSGTTASTKPSTLGSSAYGATVTDGTVVWTDQGNTNTRVTVTGNTIHNCGGNGISFVQMHLFTISSNTIAENGLSGIYIDSTCGMYTIGVNDLQGNNTTVTGGQANLRIIVPNNQLYNVYVAPQRASNSGLGGVSNVWISNVSGTRIDNVLLPNASAPSVAFDDNYRTANTAATTVISLADVNRTNRVVTIRVADANTTFQHSSSGTNSLRLNGGTNYAAPNLAVIQFMWSPNAAQWFEVARTTTG
jgi:hypothetical protein